MSNIQYGAGIRAGQKWMNELLEKHTRHESEEPWRQSDVIL